MITIAKTHDFQLIHNIAHQTWPSTYGSILSSEQLNFMLEKMYSLEALKIQATEKKHHFILASAEEKPLGFASFEFSPETHLTKIHKIYLLPQSQGLGIGKAMVQYISEEAKDQNQKGISLNVNRFNPALNFYKKIGFEIVKEENIEIGNGYLMEDYVMELRFEK